MADDLVKRLRDLGDHASFEPHMYHTAADRIEALERERDALKAYVKNDADWKFSAKRRLELFREQRARAEAAEAERDEARAKLAEVEKEREKLEIDLAIVLAREANSFVRHEAKMEAAEATVATLTAQVEALRGAVLNLPAVYAHQINTGVREVYDPLQRFFTLESVLAALAAMEEK